MARHDLKPRNRPEPSCSDFADEKAVRVYEVAMRAHRALAEGYVVEPIGEARRDGSFLVEGGAGGGRYQVDLVSDGGEHDACTCADFLGNQLGTCKHIGAARRALDEVRALRRLRPVPTPRGTTVTVDCRGAAPRLVVVGPRAAATERKLGLGDVEGRPPSEEALARTRARVVAAAVPALRGLTAAQAAARRRAAVMEAIAADALRLDVLRERLFPYQLRGVEHLVAGGRALLADDMGLGKTVQAIAAAEVLRLRAEVNRVLVVAPASLKAQWARELERYAGRQAVVVEGGPGRRRELLSLGAPWTIANYEQLWRDPELATTVGADLVILDEAQRAKNFRTRTASLLRGLGSRFLFVLTGTPVENRLDDLYSLLQLVDPATLGPLWRFNLDFHVQTSRTRRASYRNLGELRARISRVVLRRRKEEVLSQLPALSEQTRYVPLSERQAQIELSLRRQAAELMAVAQRRPLSPREQQLLQMLLLKARQACNAAVLCDRALGDDGSAKLDELELLVGEIVEQGAAKVLVFSEWTQMLRLASTRLEAMGVGHALLHGGVPTEKRPALLETFREDPAQRVLLSTDAGGVGLNLQAASYVIHLDLPWNPGRLDQRTARAHRLGQTRGVSVIYLCAQSGIERGIEGTLAGKRAVRSAALDAGSDVDTVEAPSFTGFVRELDSVLARVDADAGAGSPTEGGGQLLAEAAVAAIVDGAAEELAAAGPEAAPEDVAAREASARAASNGDGRAAGGAPSHALEVTAMPADAAAVPASGGSAASAVETMEPGFPSGATGSAVVSSGHEVNSGEAVASSPAVASSQTVASSQGAAYGQSVANSQGGVYDQAVASGQTAANGQAAVNGGEDGARSVPSPHRRRAGDRLRLAEVVLAAGFGGDAAQAAYEALAAAVRAELTQPAGPEHGALVAAAYRELVPAGRAPEGLLAALARLRDLTLLEAEGVAVDADLAASAVRDARAWVERLGGM